MTSINSSIEKLTVDPDYRHDRGHHHVYLDCQIVCRLFYKETNIFFILNGLNEIIWKADTISDLKIIKNSEK